MEEIMDEAKVFTNVSLDKDEDDDANPTDPDDFRAHLPLGEGSASSLTGIDEQS